LAVSAIILELRAAALVALNNALGVVVPWAEVDAVFYGAARAVPTVWKLLLLLSRAADKKGGRSDVSI
jgi:hypothetical protein